jgi:hypothetical protein
VSWLPPRPRRSRRRDCAPWLPAALQRARRAADAEAGRLSYVVVDELDERAAGLIVSPWPVVDRRGRVLFAEEDEDRHLAVPRGAFEQLLAKRRSVPADRGDAAQRRALKSRPVAPGDVFAAVVSSRAPLDGEDSPLAPDRWFDGSLLDLTMEGRELAQLQTSAATAGVVDARFLDEVAREQGFAAERVPDR